MVDSHQPTQPGKIADTVAQAYEAGARVAHIHLRDAQDRDRGEVDSREAGQCSPVVSEREGYQRIDRRVPPGEQRKVLSPARATRKCPPRGDDQAAADLLSFAQPQHSAANLDRLMPDEPVMEY